MKITIELATEADVALFKSLLTLPRPEAVPPSSLTMESLGLSERSMGCLARGGVSSVQELVRLSERDVLALPSMGRRSVNEIRSALANHGLHLAGDLNWFVDYKAP